MGKSNSDNALKQRVGAYFAACDATNERVILKNGGVSYRQIPYTLAGLSAAISVPKKRSLEIASGNGSRAACAVLGDALRRIERHVVERALLGELQLNAVSLVLDDLGCHADGGGTDAARIVVTLDDPERWGD